MKKTATVGTALSGLGAVALGWAAQKYNMQAQDIAFAAAALTHGVALFTAWKSKGGRQGEAD